MARQGKPFATSLELRVVYPLKDGEDPATPLKDVPRDGKTMGEVVTRGNITMKEVCTFSPPSRLKADIISNSTSMTQRLPIRRSAVDGTI
jgi:hypothetical protein